MCRTTSWKPKSGRLVANSPSNPTEYSCGDCEPAAVPCDHLSGTLASLSSPFNSEHYRFVSHALDWRSTDRALPKANYLDFLPKRALHATSRHRHDKYEARPDWLGDVADPRFVFGFGGFGQPITAPLVPGSCLQARGIFLASPKTDHVLPRTPTVVQMAIANTFTNSAAEPVLWHWWGLAQCPREPRGCCEQESRQRDSPKRFLPSALASEHAGHRH